MSIPDEDEDKELYFFKKASLIAQAVLFCIVMAFAVYTIKKPTESNISYNKCAAVLKKCFLINENICDLHALEPENPYFYSYSKEMRLFSLQEELVFQVNFYNTETSKLTKHSWESSQLPYKITIKQFSCQ